MKTIKKISLLLLASGIWLSCKKETQLLTTKDGLTHSWKLQQQGSDLNNDKKFNTEEKNEVPDSAKITYQLKNDGTGFRVGFNNNYVDTLRWNLTNNESILFLSIEDKGFVNNLYYKFEYGSKTLTLLDTTVTPGYFRYFERQD